MNMKLLGKYFCTLLLCISFIGCTSVPHVDRWIKIEEGKYDVVVDRDYLSNQAEYDYAFNSFAEEVGAETYSIQKYGPNDFYVTTPGDRELAVLPKVKHFHAGRTVTAILVPAGIGAWVAVIVSRVRMGTRDSGNYY
jgi:hypothetical protein